MKLLICEDNDLIREGLVYYLSNEGFNIIDVSNIKDAKNQIQNVDAAILDVSLPDGSGFDLGKIIKKEKNMPVIFLTAKDQDTDIDTGLEIADDYIVKPFRNRELLLRLNNLLKRNDTSIIKVNNYILDKDKVEVKKEDEVITLSSLEFKLLMVLMENKDKVLTMEYLLDFIYDITGNYVNDNTLRVYIKRLREKLNDEHLIKTIKGVGYRIDEK